LQALQSFLTDCRSRGVKAAFESATNLPCRDKLANVCLRVPTGGGKTLIAAHSIAMVDALFNQ
jgi:type III restriction enzyme